MSLIMPPNNPGLTITVYRGTSNTAIYSTKECNIQSVTYLEYPEYYNLSDGNYINRDDVTNVIYLGVGEAYTPILFDRLVVSGAAYSNLNGRYDIVQYPKLNTSFVKKLNHYQLAVRDMSSKKEGDTSPTDNSGNIDFSKLSS
jgi:hypothetical protein